MRRTSNIRLGFAQFRPPRAEKVYMHSSGLPLPARPRRHVPAGADLGSSFRRGVSSRDASSVECLDAALWYERSTLEALLAALSGPPGTDDELPPLLQERRMAGLLSSIETAALTAQLGLLPQSPDLATVIGGGWAGVLSEHDAALQRLAEQVDAAAASPRRPNAKPPLECSPLESASGEQAG